MSSPVLTAGLPWASWGLLSPLPPASGGCSTWGPSGAVLVPPGRRVAAGLGAPLLCPFSAGRWGHRQVDTETWSLEPPRRLLCSPPGDGRPPLARPGPRCWVREACPPRRPVHLPGSPAGPQGRKLSLGVQVPGTRVPQASPSELRPTASLV